MSCSRPVRRVAAITLLCIATTGLAVERFVDVAGNDNNDGSIGAPFASVAKCVTVSKYGDSCLLRGGEYPPSQAKFSPDEKTPQNTVPQITITAYSGEKVRFTGMKRLNSQWSKVQGSKCTYSTVVSQPVWQLLVGTEMQTSARWPNAYWKDMSIFNSTVAYAEGNLTSSKCGQTTGISSLADYTKQTGVNVTGAMAVMNIGSWISFTLPVTQTAADTLSYECPDPTKMDTTRFFLEGKREFIDSATEWAYEPSSSRLYLWADGCADPNGLEVWGKVESYFVQGRMSYLTFRGIEFYGLTFNLTGSEALTIDSCDFVYPVYSRRMLGETGVDSSVWKHGHLLNFTNNTVAYTDGQFLFQSGSTNSSFENNYFHHLDWSCSGMLSGQNHAGVLNLNDWDVCRWNTAHDIGPASGFRAGTGTVVEYNMIHDLFTLQNDGALIQMDGTPATRCRYNWAYNTQKRSYRYDRVNSRTATRLGSAGILHGNLGWNTSAVFVKGDSHTITNNVEWDPFTGKIPDSGASVMVLIVLGPGEASYAFPWENTHTVVESNGGPAMGCGTKNHSFAGPCAHNVEANVSQQLRSVATRDFRPLPDSEFAKAGVGPYRSDGSDYFIPGRQEHGASHPVPADGAQVVPPGSQLFFKAGFLAVGHNVWLAEEGGSFQSVPSYRTDHMHARSVRVPLRPHTRYKWGIQTQHLSHAVMGPVWSFTTAGN